MKKSQQIIQLYLLFLIWVLQYMKSCKFVSSLCSSSISLLRKLNLQTCLLMASTLYVLNCRRVKTILVVSQESRPPNQHSDFERMYLDILQDFNFCVRNIQSKFQLVHQLSHYKTYINVMSKSCPSNFRSSLQSLNMDVEICNLKQ